MASRYNTFPTEARGLRDLLAVIEWLKVDLGQNRSSIKSFTWKIGQHRFPYGIWFRGERPRSEDDRLTPGVFRKTNEDKDLDEAFINNHLQTRIQELSDRADSFSKLCIAQHYNIPTRLLDWTENFLTGIYFAVAQNHNSLDDANADRRRDGELYVLNAYSLNYESAYGSGKGRINTAEDFGTRIRAEIAFSSTVEEWLVNVENRVPRYDWGRTRKVLGRKHALSPQMKFELHRKPVAVIPNRLSPRMLVQGSAFILHGGSNWSEPNNKYEAIPQFAASCERKVWLKCKIPANCRPVIEEELFDLGVHKATLFPELDMQRDYLVKVCHK